MRKIVLVGAYGYWNFGDDLLMKLFYDLFKEWLPESEVTICSPPQGKEYIRSMTKCENILHLTSPKFWIKNLNKIRTADMVIFGGGGILYEYPFRNKYFKKDPRNISAFSYYPAQLIAPKILGFGIGIGPLKSDFSKKITKKFLRNFHYINVRDGESFSFIEKESIPMKSLCPDPSFLKASYNSEHTSENFIGIVVRDWFHIEDYVKKIKNLKNYLEKIYGEEVKIISLNKKDMINKEFDKITVWDPTKMTVDEFSEFLGSFKALITMRLHTINVAACYGVPSVTIAIDPKLSLSAQQLNLEKYICESLDIEEVINKVENVLEDKNLPILLKERALENRKSVEKNIRMLKDVVLSE